MPLTQTRQAAWAAPMGGSPRPLRQRSHGRASGPGAGPWAGPQPGPKASPQGMWVRLHRAWHPHGALAGTCPASPEFAARHGHLGPPGACGSAVSTQTPWTGSRGDLTGLFCGLRITLVSAREREAQGRVRVKSCSGRKAGCAKSEEKSAAALRLTSEGWRARPAPWSDRAP